MNEAMRKAVPAETFDEAAAPAAREWGDSTTWVHVVATGEHETAAALKQAASFADFAGLTVCLNVFHVVPYPLPLDQPNIPLEALRDRYTAVLSQLDVHACVHIYLCRSYPDAVRQCFNGPSVIYVGCPKSVWPNKEKRLARLLEKSGHNVFVVPKRSKA